MTAYRDCDNCATLRKQLDALRSKPKAQYKWKWLAPATLSLTRLWLFSLSSLANMILMVACGFQWLEYKNPGYLARMAALLVVSLAVFVASQLTRTRVS